MDISINIESTVQAAIEDALAPAVLREKVTKLVGQCVDSALENQFRSYGDFGKAVSEALKTAIPHEVSIDGAARFQHVLGQAISARLAAYNDERMTAFVQPMLDEVLKVPPATITLSELVRSAVDHWSDSWRRDGAGSPTVIVGEAEGHSSLRWVYMDPKEDVGRYQCRVSFLVAADDGKVSCLKIEGQEVKRTLFAGEFYEFERKLFALYTRGTKLVIDSTDFSHIYYPGEE